MVPPEDEGLVEATRHNYANYSIRHRSVHRLLCHIPTLCPSYAVLVLARHNFQLTSQIGYHAKVSFLPKTADCAGSEDAALFGCGLLSSYLLLFIQFFIRTYVMKKKPAKPAAIKTANGVANGANGGMANGHEKIHANGNGTL